MSGRGRRSAVGRRGGALLLTGAGLAAACKGSYSDPNWIVPPPPDPPPGSSFSWSAPSAPSALTAKARPAPPPDPLAGLPPPVPAPEVKPEAKEADDYAVYRALLEAWHNGETPQAMVIARATASSFPLADKLKPEYRRELRVPDKVVDDYMAKRESSLELVNAFGVSVPVFLVGEAELDPIFYEPLSEELKELYRQARPGEPDPYIYRKNAWDLFHKRYPGTMGIIRLSRVAYDKRRTMAIVYATHERGIQAAAGLLFVFAKGPDGWAVTGSKLLWVT